jgi:hypothetical protein
MRKKMITTPINSRALANSKFAGLKEYIEAMARHETGNYTSDLYKRANNLFGMRVPTKRPFERSGVTNNYSSYCCNEQSIRDFILYLDFVKFPTEVKDDWQFVNELKKRSYFEDNIINYYRGVGTALKNIKDGK